MMQVAEEKDIYVSSFEKFVRTRAAKDSSWFHAIRRTAIAHFAELGFPTTQQEEWRFTNVAPIAKGRFQLAGGAGGGTESLSEKALRRFTFGTWACHQLVFVNGILSWELSSLRALPQGVQIGGLDALLTDHPERLEPHLARYADYQGPAFVSLNTAFMADGAYVYVPKHTVVPEPIHLLFVSTVNGESTVSYPRNVIVADDNSQAQIVESYVGLEGDVYLTNAVTEVVAGENSIIDHYKLQRESAQAFHVATLQVELGRSASFTTHSVSLGGALVRNDVNAVLDGEGSECALNGLYAPRGHQHMDNHTVIDHAKPHGRSREYYKGILDEQSRGVFNGRIIVRPDAQKTDAQQANKNLLLSESALVNTNPQLEIYADDVKCTHGATIGQLDAEAIFYLRSRGIDRETARAILTSAFASDITSRIKIEPIRTGLECILYMGLPQGQKLMEGV